jgi:hypothetical protein
MVLESANCLRCGKQFYPRIGEEFCSPVHAREYFGLTSGFSPGTAASSAAIPPQRFKKTAPSLTGRNRLMALLGPQESELNPNGTLGPLQRTDLPAPVALGPPKTQAIAPTTEEVVLNHTLPTVTETLDTSAAPLEPVRPGKLAWYKPSISAGASRISKRQPLPVFHSDGLPPQYPVLEAAEFHPSPGKPLNEQQLRRLREPSIEGFRDSGLRASIRRETVEPWIKPVRPVYAAFVPEPRKFDWAQLIAHLADLEPAIAPPPPPATEPPVRPQRRAAASPRQHHRTPFLQGMVALWTNQPWAIRGLIALVPALAFFAIRPSLGTSEISEPVVLAKTMPPPASTVLRRMPARDQAAERTTQVSATGHRHAPAPHADVTNSVGKPDIPIATVEPKLTNVDRMLLARAAVELADDFSFGLDSWDTNNANATAWNYDQTGFIRPRGLALYRPSMSLTNYTIEFLAKIDAVAVGWVVRALDHQNYHAVKLVQRGGGPLPRYTIVRYTVVDGREGPRIEHPLPLNLYKDTLFRIRMDIRGADYSLMVQDSVVDSWTDDRFQFGGMGFFSGRGEESRVRWVQVTYQNDLLGRICAWLAPKAS